MKYYCILIFSILFSYCNCAKIAIYNPYTTHSHFNYMAKLADVLQDSGHHNVTVIIPEIDPSINVVSKKAKVVIRAAATKQNFENIFLKQSSADLMWGSGNEALKWKTMMTEMKEKTASQCQRTFEDKAFIERLKSENFDFGIFEPIDFCGYGLFKLIGIEQYAISTPMAISEDIAYALGLPGRKISFPTNHDYHPDMTFSERIENYFSPIIHSWINGMDEVHGNEHIQKYADRKFDKFEVLANARYIFANTDEHIDFPRPISHKVIYIGGITCDVTASSNSLGSDYKEIFDSAEDGVVLVSFGSLAKSSEMPLEKKEAFIKMFTKFPKINFIWKYENENDTIANELPNVFKRKWIPQKEILAHPKLLAFITHGGMNSIIESAHYGIPLLAISLFADQHRNAKMLEYRKTTITLPKTDITESTLISALTTLTQGKSGKQYRQKAKTLAAMLASKPMTPKEKFLKYVSFAIDFKDHDDHLDMKLRHQNFAIFYNFDIYGFVVIAVLIGAYLSYFTLKTIISVSTTVFLRKQKVL